MTQNDVMQMAADKAAQEVSDKDLEWLFKPQTVFELFLRLDFEGMKKKVDEWFCDMSPTAMPHRFRGEPLRIMHRAIEVEEFYRQIKEVKAKLAS